MKETIVKINWKEKLGSRKFWAMVVEFITGVLTAFAVPSSDIVSITGLLVSFGAIAIYIYSEAKVDAAREIAKLPIATEEE